TARDAVHDKVSGLDLGANDYLTKPFQIEELLARIRAHLRIRYHESKSDALEIGDLYVNLETREVKRGKTLIELTPREYDLLIYLLENKNIVLEREQIMENEWGYDYMGETNVVDVYIRYLRKKMDNNFKHPNIITVL